jgi:hypothetical protein
MQMLLASMILLAGLQEKDDPRFKYWSDCKVGSWVKTKMVVDQGGAKGEIEQTQKLLEITDDKVTIEISGRMNMGGKEIPIRPRKQDIKARYTEGDVHIQTEGDEEIEVAGKKLKCHWLDMTLRTGPNPGKMKVWMTSEIPGGGAQAEVTPPNGTTMMITAVEWEKK